MVIVAAVDRSDRAETIAREAETLAKTFDDTVHLVHVLTTSEFVNLGRTRAESGDSINMDQVHEVAEEIAADVVTDLDVPHKPIGLMGEPADQIVNYAGEEDTRYIVIAGRKRSPAGKAIFGSVAHSILMDATCPVVTSIEQ